MSLDPSHRWNGKGAEEPSQIKTCVNFTYRKQRLQNHLVITQPRQHLKTLWAVSGRDECVAFQKQKKTDRWNTSQLVVAQRLKSRTKQRQDVADENLSPDGPESPITIGSPSSSVIGGSPHPLIITDHHAYPLSLDHHAHPSSMDHQTHLLSFWTTTPTHHHCITKPISHHWITMPTVIVEPLSPPLEDPLSLDLRCPLLWLTVTRAQ